MSTTTSTAANQAAAPQFDVAIIGSGPGGYVAAIRAAQLGLSVAIIEKDKLGGICLNWGCIPTKALLRSAEIYQQLQQASSYGLQCQGVSFDLKQIVERSRGVAEKLHQGVATLMKKNKITVFKAQAHIEPGGIVSLLYPTTETAAGGRGSSNGGAAADNPKAIAARHIIIATGASPRQLPHLPIDHQRIWDYRDAMTPQALPSSLAIIGSGAIGIEFASFYAALGVEVSVIEIAERILINEDHEISAMAARSFSEHGIKIYTGAAVEEIGADTLVIKNAAGQHQTIPAAKIISAVGVVPNSAGIGLEACGVALNKSGTIAVDQYLRTNIPGIYAIGDVVDPPCLAHKASHEALICIDAIVATAENASMPPPLNKKNIPGCTYSHPQIASIGYTEEAARQQGYNIRVGNFPLYANGKAIALGGDAYKGMVKMIYEAETGEILGAHMIGAEVTEMIHSIAIAKGAELVDQDLMHAVFPHPTISESLLEATLGAAGQAIHL